MIENFKETKNRGEQYKKKQKGEVTKKKEKFTTRQRETAHSSFIFLTKTLEENGKNTHARLTVVFDYSWNDDARFDFLKFLFTFFYFLTLLLFIFIFFFKQEEPEDHQQEYLFELHEESSWEP